MCSSDLQMLIEEMQYQPPQRKRDVEEAQGRIVAIVRRLEEAGVIEGYSARLNPGALGLPLAVLIRVRPLPGELNHVAKLLAKKPSIVECDRVTGDDCFVAKAYVQTVDELEKLIDDLLPFATTNTAIIQSSPVKRRIPGLRAAKEIRSRTS